MSAIEAKFQAHPVLSACKPLLPVIAVFGYFIGALAIFLLVSRHGLLKDREVEKRSASPIISRFWRHYIMWVLAPYERLLVRSGVTPNMITFASVVTAIVSAIGFAVGNFGLGGWLYLLAGILDILDGRIARRTGQVSSGGAFFDSVMDRYAELFVFGGLAIFYRSTVWMMVVVMLAAIGSVLVSYARARGEGLGVDVNIGTMQRPERLFYLGFLGAVSPIWETLLGHGALPPFVPAVAALALLAVSTNVTAIRRITHTIDKLEARAQAQATDTARAKVVPLRAATGN